MSDKLSEIAAGLRRIGRGSTLEDIVRASKLYASLQEREPYEGVTVIRDCAYGTHERHRLDVFRPEQESAPRPVLMFVHGGGFIGGNKKTPGSPFHDNIGVWAVRNGLIGINMTYRLAPEFTWPSGAEDVDAAVAWLRTGIAAHGGDPERLFVMGASAGAVHVATYVCHPAIDAMRDGIRGMILLSGMYDFTNARDDAMLTAYIGTDPSRFAERSLVDCVAASPVPMLMTLAEHDPIAFERQGLTLVNAYFERHGHWPNFIRLMGHSHFTGSLQLNTIDTYLGTHLGRFIRNTLVESDQPAPAS